MTEITFNLDEVTVLLVLSFGLGLVLAFPPLSEDEDIE